MGWYVTCGVLRDLVVLSKNLTNAIARVGSMLCIHAMIQTSPSLNFHVV